MNPWIVFITACVGMIISGIGMAPYVPISPWVFGWLWFNVWIAIYEIYIVVYRSELTEKKCEPGFWSRETSFRSFWKDAWNEYTCYADERYLNPNDFVFLLEFMNALLILGLIVAVYFNLPGWIPMILLLQAYHCGIYFISLVHSKKTNTQHPLKTLIYLSISALWFIVPLSLL